MQDQVINGEAVINRAPKMLNFVIAPWLSRASGISVTDITQDNWREIWNSLDEDKLFYFTPFKLTAIVNRVDLRGNSGYSPGGGGKKENFGETRFIYSLIKNSKDGKEPCGHPVGDECFEGFNLIFEYGNVKLDCNFVTAWLKLSDNGLVLGTEPYNAALEAITKTVTVPKPFITAGFNNGSALNQLRTNEIGITNTLDQIYDDRSPRWQFREFKLTNPAGYLTPVPLNNEPAGIYNGADGGDPLKVAIMANWVNSNPAGTPVPPFEAGFPFKAGKSNYPSVSPFNAPGYWDGNGASPIIDDNKRHVFSLNTCWGCHSKETNTIFTHADAVGIGVPMRYVGIMDYVTDGTSFKTRISPFLTGRNIDASGFIDDFPDPGGEDLTDNTLTGLYFVSDPAGRIDPLTGVPYVRGFNDLERRLQDLFNLYNQLCGKSKLVAVTHIAFMTPLNSSH
jgi:hypothetical protein